MLPPLLRCLSLCLGGLALALLGRFALRLHAPHPQNNAAGGQETREARSS